MKILLFLFFLFIQAAFLFGQCNCPELPDDITGKTVVTVSTVSELQTALIECNAAGGNYTILLEDGFYQLEDDLLYIGQNMINLSIRSASGDRDAVQIRGKGPDGAVQYIFNVAADNFTLADLTIGNVMYHGVQIHGEADADSCLIQNVKFEDINQQFFKVSAGGSSTSDYGIVQCCWFEFTDGIGYQYYTGGIDAHASTNWLIRFNTFKHIRSPEASLSEHAIHFWNNSADNIIEQNLIIDCDRGIGFGLGSSPVTAGIIRNNFIHTSRDVGIGLESSPKTKVYHNTVITENYFNAIEYRFTATTDVHIANNITTANIASRNGGTATVESNFITGNLAIFEDPASFDYHLSNPSPTQILDAGLVLSGAGKDYDCEARAAGMGPDLGADESSATVHLNHTAQVNTLSIHPNPATAWVTLTGLTKGNSLQIVDITGRERYRADILALPFRIDLTTLPDGIYFMLQVDKKGNIFERSRFIKN